jgi:hypothetical protein
MRPDAPLQGTAKEWRWKGWIEERLVTTVDNRLRDRVRPLGWSAPLVSLIISSDERCRDTFPPSSASLAMLTTVWQTTSSS